VRSLQATLPHTPHFPKLSKTTHITKIMADFIALNGEIVALIDDLDLQFVGLSDTEIAEIPYIEL